MLKELSFENSPYSLLYDEDADVVLSKKNGILWIDYSGNEVVLQLLKKIKELEGELRSLQAINDELVDALKACDEAMSYMSEYDIPLTLPSQVKDALVKAEGSC